MDRLNPREDKIQKLYEGMNEGEKYKCKPCGWIYDPADHGGKSFADWSGPCPKCGAAKSKFEKI